MEFDPASGSGNLIILARLYVLYLDLSGAAKIGRSVNVTARIRDLQTGSPEKYEVIHLATVPQVLINAIEARAKAILQRDYPRVREWFWCSRETAIEAAEAAVTFIRGSNSRQLVLWNPPWPGPQGFRFSYPEPITRVSAYLASIEPDVPMKAAQPAKKRVAKSRRVRS